jgi:hypothetical protein
MLSSSAMKTYLQIANLAAIESMRVDFSDRLSLQTIDENLKADLRIEFEKWLNSWTAKAYREGVISATIPGAPA